MNQLKREVKTRVGQLEVQRTYEKTKGERSFQNAWKKDFSWLHYDEENKIMSCQVCTKFDTSGTFVTGCNNLRLQTVRIHNKSKGIIWAWQIKHQTQKAIDH